jgi:hypothetical protein
LPTRHIWEWYVKLEHNINAYFEGDVERVRDQALWKALLLAGMPQSRVLPAKMTAEGNQCLTRIERNGSCVMVALASRYFEKHQIELRKLHSNNNNKRRRRELQTLVLHLWYGDEQREAKLQPQVLSQRLLTLLFEPGRHHKRNVL